MPSGVPLNLATPKLQIQQPLLAGSEYEIHQLCKWRPNHFSSYFLLPKSWKELVQLSLSFRNCKEDQVLVGIFYLSKTDFKSSTSTITVLLVIWRIGNVDLPYWSQAVYVVYFSVSGGLWFLINYHLDVKLPPIRDLPTKVGFFMSCLGQASHSINSGVCCRKWNGCAPERSMSCSFICTSTVTIL